MKKIINFTLGLTFTTSICLMDNWVRPEEINQKIGGIAFLTMLISGILLILLNKKIIK